MPIRDLIVLTFFLGSVPVCFFRPFYGVLLWTVVAFLNPHRFTWGVAQDFPLAMLLAIPTILGFVVFSRGWKQLQSREVILIVLLWGWFTVTSVVSTSSALFIHHAADTWERWEFVSKILLMAVLTVGLTNSFARLRWLVVTIAGCFGILVLKSLPFMVMTRGTQRLYGPENSMVADNNDFGLALNMTLPLFFFLARSEQDRRLRWLWGFLFFATIPAISTTYSRGALVGLVFVLGLMLLQSRQRVVLGSVAVLGLLIAILFAPPAWKERMDPTREDAVDASARARLNAWAYSWNLAKDSPFTGGGFDTYTPALFLRYAPNAMDIHGPHSVYFEVLAEHGFVGLFLYLGLVLVCLGRLTHLVRQGRALGDERLVGYANMIRFSFLAFLASGTFLGRAYFDYFFTLVACTAILTEVARTEWLQQAEESMAEEQEEPPVDAEVSVQYGR